MFNQNSRRNSTIKSLQGTDPSSPRFLDVLREAFTAFDVDDSGDISLGEMRAMLERLFPDASRSAFAKMMKELRAHADSDHCFDVDSFLDAAILAIQTLSAQEVDFGKTGAGSSGNRARVGGIGRVSTIGGTIIGSPRVHPVPGAELGDTVVTAMK